MLLLSILACTTSTPHPLGCPFGTSPEGDPWHLRPPPRDPGANTPPFPTGSLRCVRDRDGVAEGPAKAWYANGRMAHELVFENGEPISGTTFDTWGRPIAKLEEGRITRTWWHADGVKAVEGTEVDRLPAGVWTEWDAAGTEIGRMDFDEGRPVGTKGTPELLPTARQAIDDHVRPPPGVQLPVVAESLEAPPLAVFVVLDARSRVTIDGETLVAPYDRMRGQLMPPVYDRMKEKAETARDLAERAGQEFTFRGEWILAADAGVPWSKLEPLLFSATQAGFSKPWVLTSPGPLQWPPTSGPVQLQGVKPVGHQPFPASTKGWSPKTTLGEGLAAVKAP